MATATTTTTDQPGRGLAELRRARGLTQIQLACEVPCSVSYVRQIEQGGLPQHTSAVLARIQRILSEPHA